MASVMVTRGISRASVTSFISSRKAVVTASSSAGAELNSGGRNASFSNDCFRGFELFRGNSLRTTPIRASKSLTTVARVVDSSSGLNTEQKIDAAVTDFILDGSKTTSIAHKVWRSVVMPGDTVIDATCGNGHDTLMLAKLVLQEGTSGLVIGLDLQQSAIDNTTALLDRELEISLRDKVSLLLLCHSQLDQIVDEDSVRLVCFNLGYQPGGDKSFITRAESTVKALRAATKVIEPRGLISIMSYVGHPGGMEEYDAIRDFVAGLPPSEWVCSHLEWTNRPLCPHLMFLFRK